MPTKLLLPAEQDERYLPFLDEVVGEALDGYEREGGYHIRQHGVNVIDVSVENRQKLISAGVTDVPSLYVTVTGAAEHDEGFYRYFTDPKLSARFPTSEAYTRHLSNQRQKRFGVDAGTRREIGTNIGTTQAGVPALTWGAFNLCAADLHNTTLSDREVMKRDTETLRWEFARLKFDLGEVGYRIFAAGLLATYHQVNLNFSRIAEAGDVFVERRRQMGQNILALMQDVVEQSHEDIKDLITQISPPFLGPVLSLLGIKKTEESQL